MTPCSKVICGVIKYSDFGLFRGRGDSSAVDSCSNLVMDKYSVYSRRGLYMKTS
jgi:hypothetical protein